MSFRAGLRYTGENRRPPVSDQEGEDMDDNGNVWLRQEVHRGQG